MRRRTYLAGLAGLGTVGGGVAVFRARRSSDGVEPVRLETIEAPGSSGEDVAIPERGRVTFVEFFATWCHVCAASMPAVGEAYDRVGDDVQFVSVTNEPLGHAVTRAEIRDWWVDHDGRWPVATDSDLQLTERLDVRALPTVLVLDADNVVRWDATGKHSAATLVERIDAARDEGQP
ncbi:TlpA family protein disulfide reductase [Haloarcula salina]|uniref:TlpA family protein disulfide reductase n=1 Tax=Haloarcula salina TaxID=1429914 RepID=A0AA41KBM3_9EURY|nr:TlpA disulfide reductase family protein [Haloarcula salina]MBV0901375.1 TlpA family protein disulfide reductase [Haloarcula salina]